MNKVILCFTAQQHTGPGPNLNLHGKRPDKVFRRTEIETEKDCEMFQPEKYSQGEIRRIKRACCRVFMSEKAMHSVVVTEHHQRRLRYPFLEQLTYEDVKRAYRRNVFAYHPDRHQDKKSEDIDFYARHIEGLNHSYEYLSTLFNSRKAGSPPESAPRSRIIAVGGAKGGIGKSIFAANLGAMLSSLGFRTIMVDLDLGGSDLYKAMP